MDDETRAFVRTVFESAQDVPADLVPYPELTPQQRRAHLLEANETQGTWAEITVPGDLITDVDGLPVGVGPNRTQIVHRSTVVTTRDLERAGLTPDDVPSLTVIAPPTKKEKNA